MSAGLAGSRIVECGAQLRTILLNLTFCIQTYIPVHALDIGASNNSQKFRIFLCFRWEHVVVGQIQRVSEEMAPWDKEIWCGVSGGECGYLPRTLPGQRASTTDTLNQRRFRIGRG